MLEIEPHVLAGQMRWQAWPLSPRSRCLGCRRWKRGFDLRDVSVEIVKTELQLVVVEPFGAPAKLATLQLLNDEPEPFDLRRDAIAFLASVFGLTGESKGNLINVLR